MHIRRDKLSARDVRRGICRLRICGPRTYGLSTYGLVMHNWLNLWSLFGVILLTHCCGVAAWGFAPADAEAMKFFEAKIRPVLIEHCYRCHAADAKSVKGGLLLDTREGIRRGGDSGAAVEPGDPAASLLLEAIRYESYEMPPDRKLPDGIVQDFQKWIEMGAPDPREAAETRTAREINIDDGKKFWAFQPLQSTSPPPVSNSAWPQTEIDHYILAGLESAGLEPVADADRETLIRRVYYALIGLPPSAREINQFVTDPEPLSTAMATLVDRLLDSKHFGERWGRHWLDVVRFAESSGGGRTLMFPDAWRYRDYVIEAFNADLPYDQFVEQQIAGDLLDSADWREKRRHLTATALLVLGPTNYELQDKDVLEMDIVDEQLDTIGSAFLGMTIGCARCHDHKFDPIPTSDYYALAGILKNTRAVIHSNVSKWNETELPLPPEQDAIAAEYERRFKTLQRQKKSLQAAFQKAGGKVPRSDGKKSIDPATLPGLVIDDTAAELTGDWNGSTSVGGFVGERYLVLRGVGSTATYTARLPEAGEYEIRMTYTPHNNRSARTRVRIQHGGGETVVHVNQKQPGSISNTITSLGSFPFVAETESLVEISSNAADGGAVIADAILFISRQTNQVRSADVAESRNQKQQAAQRAKLQTRLTRVERELTELEARRPQRDLAMAVADLDDIADIPIAIRGVVHNPGPIVPRGLLQVALTGDSPTMPENSSGRLEMAHWIASPDNPLTARVMVNRIWCWLFGSGLVHTVDNFGAMGDEPSHPELLDHLARQFIAQGWSVKKLIRQLMLSRVYHLSSARNENAIAVDPDNRLRWRMDRHRLDAESIRDTLLLLGGNLDKTMGGSNIKSGTTSEYGYQFTSTRRSVYVPVFRNALPGIFETFDFADPNIQVGQRRSSTTAPQALLLMNHPMVMEQSQKAAERLLSSGDWSLEKRVNQAYLQVLGRSPSPREIEIARRFLGQDASEQDWGLFYQTLFQSVDFRYLH